MIRKLILIATVLCSSLALAQATKTGPISAKSINNIRSADRFLGSDIGAKVNAAIADCGGTPQCPVYIPAGNYSYSTVMNVPAYSVGMLKLYADQGAVLSFTGSGTCAVNVFLPTAGAVANLTIEGLQISGTSSGKCGISLPHIQGINVRKNVITGFTTGDGIYCDGCESVVIDSNFLQGNKNNIHEVDISAGPNANRIVNNIIASSVQWGILEDATNGNGAQNNVYSGNTFESNGSTSSFGDLHTKLSFSPIVTNNYTEGSPRTIALGEASFATFGATVSGNSFTSSTTTHSLIELVNAPNAFIANNYSVLPGSPSTCYVDVTTAPKTILLGYNGSGANASNQWCASGVGGSAPTDALYTDESQGLHGLIDGTIISTTGTPAWGGATNRARLGWNVSAADAEADYMQDIYTGGTYAHRFYVANSSNTGYTSVGGFSPLGNWTAVGTVIGQAGLQAGASGTVVTDSRKLAQFPASLVTTAATTDNVSITGVTSSSHCSLTPTNASAATNIATSFVSAKTTNQITVTHTATGSMTYDILCTAN